MNIVAGIIFAKIINKFNDSTCQLSGRISSFHPFYRTIVCRLVFF